MSQVTPYVSSSPGLRYTFYIISVLKVQNGILLPSLQPALPFLDLHGVQRLEFHTSVLEEIRDRLLQRIQDLAASNDKNKLKILNDILVKSFPVVKVVLYNDHSICYILKGGSTKSVFRI